jgi:hypothetical protein
VQSDTFLLNFGCTKLLAVVCFNLVSTYERINSYGIDVTYKHSCLQTGMLSSEFFYRNLYEDAVTSESALVKVH